jgi:glutaredoxin
MSQCPYCQKELIKEPTRKSKCPHCKEDIYVKKHPETKEITLATKEQADKLDKQYKTIRFINHWKNILFEQYGFPQVAYDNIKKQSGSPLEKDHIFSGLNQVANDYVLNGRFQEASSTWYNMALFIEEENMSGFNHCLKQSRINELRDIKQTAEKLGMKPKAKVMTAGPSNSCPACQKLDGITIDIGNPENQDILPHKECNHNLHSYNERPFCRCCFVIDMD